MATFFKARVIFAVAFFCLVAMVIPRVSHASSNPSYDAAMSKCQTDVAAALAQYSYYTNSSCTVSGQYVVGKVYNGSWSVWEQISFSGTPPPPNSPCSSMPDDNMGTAQALDRTSALAVQMCDVESGYGAGNGSGCVATFQPGTGVANSQGGYVFAGTWHASGVGCTPNPDGSFTPDNSSVPQAPPVGPTKPPVRSCGGGSCVDPSSGQACIVDQSGQQFCTPTGSAAPTATPNCYSDGSSATLCVGTPNAPPAPNPPVTDAATQITSSDTYRVSTSSGQTTSVVNVFNTSGGTTSSGQKSTDSGLSNGGQPNGLNPAHSSSAGGNGTYQGGTDCNTPPVCTGDAVLCGASRTQWATTCQVHTDLVGTSPAPSATSLATGGSYDQGSVWTTPSTGNTVGDQANAGNYDQSGFGYGAQCPFVDTHVTFMSSSFSLPWSEACDATSYLRWVVIGFALYLAACITAGSNR